jgi:hypothetical protein
LSLFEWLTGTPYPVARRMIVNLKDGTRFRGVLWQRRAGWLVLRNAEVLPPNSKPIPMDGEVLVFKSDVSFMQVLTEVAG